MSRLNPFKGDTYTFDEALIKAGFGWFHWKLLIFTGAVYAAESISVMIMVFIITILEDQWNLSNPWGSMIGIILFVGQMIGSVVISWLADKHGRRNMVIFCSVLLAVSGTLTIAAPDIYTFLICRFVSGFAVSGSIVSLTLFQEWAPVHWRVNSMVYEQQCWSVGALFSVLLAWIVLPNFDEEVGWRVYVGLSVLPLWCIAMVAIFIPESARWCWTVGEYEKAEELVQKMFKVNGVEGINGRLVREEVVTVRGRPWDMLVPEYYRTTFLLMLLCLTSLMTYFDVVFVSTKLFTSNNVYLCVFVTTLGEVPSLLLGLLISKTGRKFMIVLTWVISAVCFAIIIAMFNTHNEHYSDVINIICIFTLRCVLMTNWTATILYVVEYYPTAIRATALGMGYAMSKVGSIIGIYLPEGVNMTVGSTITATFCVVSVVLTCFLKVDTSDKVLTNEVDRTGSKLSGRTIGGKSNPYVLASA